MLHGEERLKIYDREQFNHETYKVDMKQAAFIAALQRLANAMRVRGLFPA